MRTTRAHIELCTEDPGLAATFKLFEKIPKSTPEYHECMASILMILARSYWRDADRIREAQADRAARRARARKTLEQNEKREGKQ